MAHKISIGRIGRIGLGGGRGVFMITETAVYIDLRE